MTECIPFIPILVTNRTTEFMEFIAIYRNLIHLFENNNSLQRDKCGNNIPCVVHGTYHTLRIAFLISSNIHREMCIKVQLTMYSARLVSGTVS